MRTVYLEFCLVLWQDDESSNVDSGSNSNEECSGDESSHYPCSRFAFLRCLVSYTADSSRYLRHLSVSSVSSDFVDLSAPPKTVSLTENEINQSTFSRSPVFF